MKTNELNNGIKEVYAKPALEVEEMEVQWEYMSAETGSTTPEGSYSQEFADANGGSEFLATVGIICPNT